MNFCISVFLTLAGSHLKCKVFESQNQVQEKKQAKYSQEKKSDPPNTHEKNFGTHEKKFQTHETPRDNFRPTRARWHDGTKPMRPTIARDPRNLAHSILLWYTFLLEFFSPLYLSFQVRQKLQLLDEYGISLISSTWKSTNIEKCKDVWSNENDVISRCSSGQSMQNVCAILSSKYFVN